MHKYGLPTPRRTPRKYSRYNMGSIVSGVVGGVSAALGLSGMRQSSGAPGTSNAVGRAVETSVNNIRNFNVTQTAMRKRKRRRVSRKRIKRMRRFKRSVLNIVEGHHGHKVFSTLDSFTIGATLVDRQAYVGFAAYGNNAGSVRGFDDIGLLTARDDMSAATSKFFIHSYWCNYTISNLSTTNTYVVDIYEWNNKKPKDYGAFNGFDDEYDGTITSNGAQTGMTAFLSGTVGTTNSWHTPFDNPDWLTKYEILSKRTFLMPPGDLNQFEVKRGKTFFYDGVKQSEYLLLKPSFGYLFVVRGAPTAGAYAAPTPGGEIVIKSNRSYRYSRGSAGVNSEMDNAAGYTV